MTTPAHKLRKKTFAERLQEAVGKRTLEPLAKALGIGKTTLSMALRGKSKPSAETVGKIIELTGVDAAWLLLGKGEMRPPDPADRYIDAVQEAAAEYGEGRVLPLLAEVECSSFVWAESFEDDPEYIPVMPDLFKDGRFILRGHGDSMAPAILQGDLCIFDPKPKPTNDRIVVAQLADGDVGSTIKRYIAHKGQVELHPENRVGYGILVLVRQPDGSYLYNGSRVELLIKGVLVALVRKY